MTKLIIFILPVANVAFWSVCVLFNCQDKEVCASIHIAFLAIDKEYVSIKYDPAS